MRRLGLRLLAALAVTLIAPPAEARDFGSFVEEAARGLVRKSLSPEHWKRVLTPRRDGELYPVRTADGWTLVAHRYRPSGGARPGALPVILCHGLSYNASFWALEPSSSLAVYLSGLGYDVWAVDLRGCGLSQKWVYQLEDAPTVLMGGLLRRATRNKVAPTGFATLDPRYASWNLDHHVAYDLPALVKLVRHQTGSEQVTWVGHSMGGIVALCHLSRYPNPGIGRLVTVGSQVTIPDGQVLVQFLLEMIKTRQGQLAGAPGGAELLMQSRASVHNMFFNEHNVSPAVYEVLASSAKDVPSLGLLQQYMVLGTKGELFDSRKEFNYAEGLGNVRIPILIAGGESDQLAPPLVQQFLYQNVGSVDKLLMIFGRSQGFAIDSGHNDALVGLGSRPQVYPAIERWLAGARPRPGGDPDRLAEDGSRDLR